MDPSMRSASHGRGGAGNYSNKSNKQVDDSDLRTPTIKQQHYTTGRGGTGNIVSNDNPENARRAQDVDTPEHHSREAHGTYHWGRGGEGNKMTVGDGDRRPAAGGTGTSQRKGSFKGAMDKAKEAVGLGKKEKKDGEGVNEKEGESAVAD